MLREPKHVIRDINTLEVLYQSGSTGLTDRYLDWSAGCQRKLNLISNQNIAALFRYLIGPVDSHWRKPWQGTWGYSHSTPGFVAALNTLRHMYMYRRGVPLNADVRGDYRDYHRDQSKIVGPGKAWCRSSPAG